MYWSGNLALNQSFCFIAVILYRKHTISIGGVYGVDGITNSTTMNSTIAITNSTGMSSEGGGLNQDLSSLFVIVFVLFSIAIFSFRCLLKLITKKYLHTFFSMQSGNQLTVANYYSSDNDSAKWDTFDQHRNYSDP